IAAPGFLIDGQKRGIVRSRRGEAGLDATRRLLAAETVRNRYDERLGQWESPSMRKVIWGTPSARASRTRKGTAAPFSLLRGSALVAATAVRIAIAHAAPPRRAGLLIAGRVAGGAGLAGSAALLLHLMSRRVAGCSRLAGH